jgi:hypothetical protein
MKGDYAVIVTYINNQKVTFRTSAPFKQYEPGDAFTLEYNCKDSKIREVLFYRPRFLADDDFLLTKGKIIRTFPVNCIEFSYKVGDTVYTRFQKVKSLDSIDINKTYTVGYIKLNPRRAIMKFQ